MEVVFFGFKSMGVYVPNLDLYVVGLTNCDCIAPRQITRDIAAQFINNALKAGSGELTTQ